MPPKIKKAGTKLHFKQKLNEKEKKKRKKMIKG